MSRTKIWTLHELSRCVFKVTLHLIHPIKILANYQIYKPWVYKCISLINFQKPINRIYIYNLCETSSNCFQNWNKSFLCLIRYMYLFLGNSSKAIDKHKMITYVESLRWINRIFIIEGGSRHFISCAWWLLKTFVSIWGQGYRWSERGQAVEFYQKLHRTLHICIINYAIIHACMNIFFLIYSCPGFPLFFFTYSRYQFASYEIFWLAILIATINFSISRFFINMIIGLRKVFG